MRKEKRRDLRVEKEGLIVDGVKDRGTSNRMKAGCRIWGQSLN